MSRPGYTVIRSDRKTISLELRPDGEAVVRCPRRMKDRDIARFVESRQSWLEGHRQRLNQQASFPALSRDEVTALKQKALRILQNRVPVLAEGAQVDFGRVSVRAMRTRWGSCSASGNLSFNCLLALCPPEVMDYVILHELCHRRHMDHSAAFWAEVAILCPDYRQHRAWLKEHGSSLIARLPE